MSSYESSHRPHMSIEDAVDKLEDALWKREGGTTGVNDGATRCPGDKTVLECSTTKLLMNGLLSYAYGIELPATDTDPTDIEVVNETNGLNRHVVSSSCQLCASECNALTRVKEDGQVNEKIRFRFKDQDLDPDEARQMDQSARSERGTPHSPTITTVFDGTYYKFGKF